MAITERLMGTGNFTVTFSQEFTPTEIIESITEWGHIVVTPQEIDVDTLADSDILSTARYTGIVLNRELEEGFVNISGQGLQLYLGDGEGKGQAIAETKGVGSVRVYKNTTLAETLFQSTAVTNKPLGIMRNESGNTMAITQGNIFEPSGTYSGSHFVQTSLAALKEVSEVLSTEYRINSNGTIDAGPSANLFAGVNSDPTTIVVRTGYGEDPAFEGIVPQGLKTEFDATDFVSRVDFVGEVGYFDTATDVAGEATISSNPYKDLHGNELTRVGMVQQPEVDADLLNSRAQLILNELSRIKKVLNLDLEQYEVSGDFQVGDFIFAFDPDIGFVDTSADATAESRDLYEVTFRGQNITPVKVRVLGITFPVSDGMGVYYRDKDGNYTDLSPYVQFESGSAQVELGDVIRFVGDDLRFDEFSLSRVTAGVFSIPDLPTTPTLQAGTYLDATGNSKGFIRVTVAKPTNENGSQITDGSHYKVRYKKTTDTQYSYQNFPFTGVSSESLLLQDLTVGVTYDIGVAVVDKSGNKKMSAYDGSGEDLYTNSSSVNPSFATNARVEIEKDGQAPSKPKTATIAAGPLRVQVTHYLGKDGTDGNGNPFGNFTLEGDVDHLDVHAVDQDGNVQDFTVNTANKIGEIRVTSGNLLQAIPVIGTIEVEDSVSKYFRIVAVDKSGNESSPSDGQSAGGNLIAEANISDATITTAKIGDAQITTAKIGDAQITSAKVNDLSADKLTSGSIIGGEIIVGSSSNTSGFIKSQNYSSGSAGWQISPDGSAEFQNATIRGSLNAGDITAGTININRLPTITTSQINFDAGDIGGAESGTILATINASSEGITIDAAKLNLTGVLAVGANLDDTNIGTIAGITISGTEIASSNFSSTDGFKIKSDGDAFFNSVDVRVDSASSATPSTGKTTLDVGDTQIYTFNDDLYLNTTGTNNKVFIRDQLVLTLTSTSGSTMQLLFDGLGTNDDMGFRLESNFPTSPDDADLIWTNQSGADDYNKIAYITTQDDYLHLGADAPGIKTDFTGSPTLLFDGPGSSSSDSATFNMSVRPYAIKDKDGDLGTSGQVLSSTGSRIDWIDLPSGNDHPDSDHSFAATSHSHSESDISNIGSHAHSSTSSWLGNDHGLHVSFAGTGSQSTVARSDHTHSGSSGISTISANGTATGSTVSFSTSGTSTFLSSISSSGSTVTFNKSTSGSISVATPTGTKKIGVSTSNRFSNMYSQNFFGTFYGQNINASSRNIKENIVDTALGLDFINDLTVKDFTMIDTDEYGTQKYTGLIAEDIQDYLTDNSLDYKLVEDYSSKYEYRDRCSHPAICTNEELENFEEGNYTCEETCCEDYFKFTEIDGTVTNWIHDTVEECEAYMPDENRHPHLYFNNFIGPLVKAVQELSAENEALKSRVEALEG